MTDIQWEGADDELSAEEENAIASIGLVMTDLQLQAAISIFAQILANRQNITEHRVFEVEVNRPPDAPEPGLIVMPGGKV